MQIKNLSTGYTLLRISSECWAQYPSDFSGHALPDEYIFNPSWNREIINELFTRLKPDEEHEE